MNQSLSVAALLGLVLLGGCVTDPSAPGAPGARADVVSSVPASAGPVAAPAEEMATLAPEDRTGRPVPAQLAASPGAVMIESPEDREVSRRRQLALRRMITRPDPAVAGDGARKN